MAEFHDVPDFLDAGAAPADAPAPFAPPRGAAAPTRAELVRRRRRALIASGVWLAVQLVAFGVRPDLAALPAYYVVAVIAGPFAAGALAVVASLHPGRWGLGLRTPLLMALSFLAPAGFILAGLATPLPTAAPSAGGGVFCFNAILAWTLLPMVSASLVLRRSFAAGPVYRSALLGGGVGLIAGALFTLHCPVIERFHVAFAHGAAVAIAAIAGGLVLSRATRI